MSLRTVSYAYTSLSPSYEVIPIKFLWVPVKNYGKGAYRQFTVKSTGIFTAQADLDLRCPHMPEDTFSHGEVHIRPNKYLISIFSQDAHHICTTELI